MHTGAQGLYSPHELSRGGPYTACRFLTEMGTVVHGLLCRMCGREAPADGSQGWRSEMKEEGKVIPHDFQVMARCSMSDLASIGSGSLTSLCSHIVVRG